jgi:hypothetical protein
VRPLTAIDTSSAAVSPETVQPVALQRRGVPRSGRWARAGLALVSLFLALPMRAMAAPPDEAVDPPPPVVMPTLTLPEIHGFLSQGYVRTTGNNYLFQNSLRGTYDFTEVALNFTEQLTDRLRVGIQLFARDIDGQGTPYRIDADWAYVDYRFRDWLGFRAGRTKLPFGLYNEVHEIDAAHIPILLPQSVYPFLNRDLLLAQTGAELYGYVEIQKLGSLEYRLYGGTLTTDTPAPPKGLTLTQFRVSYVGGGRLMWQTPLDGLRVGGSVQTLKFVEDLATASGAPLDLDFRFVLWLASAEYSFRDWLIAGEFGRWHAEVDTNTAAPAFTTNSRYYVMAGYRLRPWLTPAVYYSGFEPHLARAPVGNAKYQHDIAATLRFDVNSFWLFKLEGHYISGTADLDSGINGGTPLAQLPASWMMFLAKTTVYF